MFMSPHVSPLVVSGGRVFVANTPAETVDILDARTGTIVTRVRVGIDPVSLAVRPDGREVWVANHVSDSVSVIDTDPASPTHLQVIATVQEFDMATKATRFDEPVGIAFASNEKAYVALSSENQIAVIDVARREVTKRLTIPAQDPRAVVVRGGRLYVIPFESGNQTQLSGGGRGKKLDGDLVTFDAWAHSVAANNVLSLGHVVDIVKHPRVPDRDLFVFDTADDTLVSTFDTLGTLLYGLAVDSKGHVFIAQTDARNEVNGRAGTRKHGLAKMENRAFLNRITSVAPDGKISFIELEPLPPQHPAKGQALATPFAIEVSEDNSTLVVSASGSDKLFTVSIASGKVLGRVEVGSVPEGIALECGSDGKPARAWVYNAGANSVSLVDVSQPAHPRLLDTVELQDPTPPDVKRGRIAFETAKASTTETFSCASCHPNGHTDQLLWVLKTPIVTGGNQIMPRSTMPVRGLRDTEPYHWDGIPGDPYRGIHSASLRRKAAPNSTIGVPETSTRFLIDAGLASTMALEGDPSVNDEGKPGALTGAERDAMAKFLLSVPYPPAQRRAYDNVLSREAVKGFRLFHVDGDNDPSRRKPNVCGDCHRMPSLVSTDTPGTGMDAPTWRGAYDRWLILPQGRLNIIDFDFYEHMARRGAPERDVWRMSWGGRERFDPVWNLVLEGSTGFSGAFARQVTLSRESTLIPLTRDLLEALEESAREGAVVLQGEGVLVEGKKVTPVAMQFETRRKANPYITRDGGRSFTRSQLLLLAAEGRFVATFTARLGNKMNADHPQPGLWTLGPIHKQRGRQEFPILHRGMKQMTVSGRHIDPGAFLVVDGRRFPGTVKLKGNEVVAIELRTLPPVGMHLLQLQNPNGLFSNDFIFHVAQDASAAAALTRDLDTQHSELPDLLAGAIARGDLLAAKRHHHQGADLNERRREGGSTPLSTAALHGRLEIARYLIEQGASVNATNRDGNTPLHTAAFLCREDIVKLLLEEGASLAELNNRGESPVDVVSGAWSDPLADFYRLVEASADLELNLERIQQARPRIAQQLRQHAPKPGARAGQAHSDSALIQ